MTSYTITRSALDIRDTACIVRRIQPYPTGYKLTFLLDPIATLFDCLTWMSHKNREIEILFFGFEEDTDLCVYFYHFLCKTILAEAAAYKQTDAYQKSLRQYHGRSVIAAFIRGIQRRLGERIRAIQTASTIATNNRHNLIEVKLATVKAGFDALGIRLYAGATSAGIRDTNAYEAGRKRGDAIEITTGRTLRLT